MKKSKIILGFLFLVMLQPGTFAQSATERRGVKYYELYSYEKAIYHLERISIKSSGVLRMLADSYYKTGRYSDSEKAYFDLVKREDRIAQDLYGYAYVLAINGKYSDSGTWMDNYATLVPDDTRAQRYLQNPYFYRNLSKDNGQFTIKNLDFNNEQSDFGVAFFDDKIVFTSTRPLPAPFKRLWRGNNLPFLNLFVADLDEEGQFTNIRVFYEEFNEKYHDGPASFARDGSFMAITRNSIGTTNSVDGVNLSIFTSRRQDTQWSEPQPFTHNSNKYSVGHAALTPDGRTMYFASDMPGGFGGVDLYSSQLGTDGLWSVPENLGSTINTEGDEMFPFYHPNGYLFFSSDGLPGLGGLDIFFSNITDPRNPSAPINLGATINSNSDDFSFIIDKEMEKGYFSSNRTTGKGQDDIYAFEMHAPLRKIIQGIVYDARENVLADVTVNLLDDQGNILQTSTSGPNGAFEFLIDKDMVYKLEASRQDYFPGETIANVTSAQTEITARIELMQVPQFSVSGIVSDVASGEPMEGVKIQLVNNNIERAYNLETTPSGEFSLDLLGLMLNDELSLTLVIDKYGYIPRTIAYKKTVESEGQIDLNAELDLTLKKMEVGDDLGRLLGLKPINNDADDTELRPDDTKELDKIAEIMNKYPDMEVELGSHTDCRGSAAYNMRLSIIRAQSATWYVQSLISNPNRVYSMGYGEFRPFNDCKCNESNRSSCTEEELLQNRRTEFIILRIE